MNGLGVGTAVAVGIEIGARIISPELYFSQVLMIMVLYGAIFGYIFHIYKMALSRVHPPFHRQ
jgi:hypothetical protein